MKPQFKKSACIILLGLLTTIAFSQGEANKWYFGTYAGLNFNSSPPSVINTSTMSAIYSCASVADGAGNLLFYTNGATVWDKNDAVMANGTGLNGSSNSGSQRVMIIKKPAGTNIYYIFTTMNSFTGPTGLYYSEVDVSLASGNGSVTIKNNPVYTITPSSSSAMDVPSKITATKHCNGSDIWLVVRDWHTNFTMTSGNININNSFRSFQITSSGVNTTAVVSTPLVYSSTNNAWAYNDFGSLKISPNGKKLATSHYNALMNTNYYGFELYDFDNSTGVVSNSLSLVPLISDYSYCWGLEFSPDGSKLYGSKFAGTTGVALFQWDLCAGSPTAIIASIYTVAAVSATPNFGGVQRGPDNKIYITRSGQTSLDVINNPNALGSACGYSALAQSAGTNAVQYALPNFMNSYAPQHPATVPFTVTPTSCQTASFNSIYMPGSFYGCAASGYSVTGMLWSFGDPSSGSANSSTLTSPVHAYTSIGTYTAQLILYYSCGGGSDTLRQAVNVMTPCLSVSSTSITCATLGSATVTTTTGTGPFVYNWMPGSQTGSVVTGLSPGAYTITVFDFATNTTHTTIVSFASPVPLAASLVHSNSLTCHGMSTGTANVTGISGGSGSYSYLWSKGSSSFTTSMPTGLSAGTWSFTLSDNLTACSVNSVFVITQPPALSLAISGGTACTGGPAILTGTASGGINAVYNYSWTGGPSTESWTVSPAVAGIYIYTLSATDANNCLISGTTSATFIASPALSVSSVSICPSEVATLSVSGASSYTWTAGSTTLATGSSFTDNPLSSSSYTVKGSALGCTAITTASITLKPVPVPTLSANNPVCSGQPLQLQGGTGISFYWTGPQSFASSLQNPFIAAPTPSNSGLYSATVTAANNCTALAGINVTVNPLPTIVVAGNNVACAGNPITQTLSGAMTYSLNNTGTATTFSLLPGASTVYTLSGTNSEGCIGITTKTITVHPLPVITVSGNHTLCAGSSVTLSASGATTFSWNSSPAGSIITISPPASTNYTVTGTDNNACSNSVVFSVTVMPVPVLSISGNTSVCEGSAITQTVSGAVSYSWSTGALTATAVLAPTATTVYTITGTDVNGCSSFVNSSISVDALPVLSVSSSGTPLCTGETATMSVSGGISWLWDTGPTTPSITVTPTVTTIYTVTGTAANGCTSSITIVQTVDNCMGMSFQAQPGNVIKVWPNPGKGLFKLTNSRQSDMYVDVYTALGILMKQTLLQGESDVLDLGDAANGAYFLVVRIDGMQQVIKVIKE